MSAEVQVSSLCKLAASNARKSVIDAGTSNGKIRLYTSPRTPIDTLVTATLIVEIPLTDPCGTVDLTGLHLTSSGMAQVVNSGVIDWGCVVDSDGNPVFSGTALQFDDPSVATAAFVLDRVSVFSGAFVTLLDATLSEGG